MPVTQNLDVKQYSRHREKTRPSAATTWWETIMFWTERSRQRGVLGELDQHELDDMGITRDDAARETKKHFWR